jgi:PAS domain S-box-containing protein
MNGLDFVHPDDVQNAAEDLAKLIQHPGSSIRKELRAKHNDGSWRAAEITAANLLDNPAVGGIVINFRDITERKKAEDKIRLGELHLRELLGLHRMTASTEKEILNFTLEASARSLQSPFAFIDIMSADEAEMTIYAWSKGAMEQCAITEKPIHLPVAEAGLWGEAVRQRRPIVVNDYDTSTEFKKGYPKSHVPIKRFLCIPVFSAGRIVAVAAVANKVSEYDEADTNALTSLLHEMWNLMERKQAEEARRVSEEKYRLVVENASEAILVVQDGAVRFFNPRVIDMFGYSGEELVSKPFIEFLHSEDQAMVAGRYMARQEGKEVLPVYPLRVVNKTGNVRWVEVSAVVFNWEGSPATLTFLSDITERRNAEEEKKKMEEQLRLAGRLAAVGELSAGVAHELNNPLAAIQGYAQFLTMNKELEESVKKDVDIIYREALRASKITQNLLSFARQHEPSKSCISLNEVIEKTMELRTHQMKVNNIELVTELAPDLPNTTADFYQMQQVFANIINNAEQAMTDAHGRGKLTVRSSRTDGLIQIGFTDDGPGISEENMKRIFDPFFTTKEVGKGTGLVLSICYGIVEAHGGRLYARSKLGEGTTFFVEIPIVAEGQQR